MSGDAREALQTGETVPEDYTFSDENRSVFDQYVKNQRPNHKISPGNVRSDHDGHDAETVSKLWERFKEFEDVPIGSEEEQDLYDGFRMEMTVYGAAEHAGVHPAQAFAFYKEKKENGEPLSSKGREPYLNPKAPDVELQKALERHEADEPVEKIAAELDAHSARIRSAINHYEEMWELAEE